MRLFVAINIPREVKEKISKLFLNKIPHEFKKVEKENLHLTLLFIGETSEGKAREISEKMRKIEFEEFEFMLKGIGSFSERVIWIGISQGKENIELLAKKTSEALELKNEKFHAHLTIARNKKAKKQEFKELMEKFEKNQFEEKVKVDSIKLMKSELTPREPIYSLLSERTFSKRDSGL